MDTIKRRSPLSLRSFRMPIGAWVSILHRASGAMLALSIPGLLYALMLSLRSEADFERLLAFFDGGLGRLMLAGLLWASLHHMLAGLRHLGLDLGWGVQRLRARQTAWTCLAMGLGVAGLLMVWGL